MTGRTCVVCGVGIEGRHFNASYCSVKCRAHNQRERSAPYKRDYEARRRRNDTHYREKINAAARDRYVHLPREQKFCVACGVEISAHRPHNSKTCSRECVKKWDAMKSRARYYRDPEKANASTKRWQSENRARHRSTAQEWAKKNRDKLSENRRNHYIKDPDTFKERARKYYAVNAERRREYARSRTKRLRAAANSLAIIFKQGDKQ